ncbi:hypothetical protein ACJMK2_005998 [Sinanodonta woodiana]|uniref:Histone-lysine N-methyltransferase NSD2 n=1 Tax=Sinanodonta woodiana TaxID=1069815 RepID=A0ABD3VUZ6_SINWO
MEVETNKLVLPTQEVQESHAKVPQINGNDSQSPPFGYRHHMPQIAMMSRNPKIAQSKSSAKAEAKSVQKATLHVEEAGKIIHIGSDLVEGEHLLEKKNISIKKLTEGENGQNNSETDCTEKNKAGKEENLKHSEETDKKTADKLVVENVAKSESKIDREKIAAVEKKSDSRKKSKVEITSTVDTNEKPTIAKADEIVIPSNRSRSRRSLQASSEIKSEVTSKASETAHKKEVDGATPTRQAENKRQRKPKIVETEPQGTLPLTKAKAPTLEPEIPKEKPNLEAEKPPRWLVGDLVWSKVTGHPWWPCMVSYDPWLGIYTRIQGRQRQYHVQFFGDAAERGWMNDTCTLPFEGKDKFDDYVQETLAKCKKSDKQKLQKSFQILPSRLKAVTIGIQAAEVALPLSRNERKAKYTFTYELPKSKGKGKGTSKDGAEMDTTEITPSEKGKISDSHEEETDSGSTKTRKRKLKEIASPETPQKSKKQIIETASKAVTSPVSRPPVTSDGSFEVFCQKEGDNVMAEHPEFNEQMLKEYLEQQWIMMSLKQKSRYKSKYEHDTDVSPRTGRKRKPSMKKLEAEEDNKLFTELFVKKGRKNSGSPTGTQDVEQEEKEDPKEEIPKKKKSKPVSEKSTEATASLGKKGVGRTRKSESVDSLHVEQAVTDENSSSVPDASGPKRQKEKETNSVDDPLEYEPEIFRLSAAGPQKKENLCNICEQTGELLECEGPCQGQFHLDCLGLTMRPTGVFKCDECSTGVHICFICKKSENNTRRCSVVQCGRFYHEECVKQFPQTRCENGKGFICPLHVCHTCWAESAKNPKTMKGPFLRCVRCPTAYHVGDFCLAAGSISLAGFNIVCTRHFQPLHTQKHHSHVNVPWCFQCNKGGTLLCCESCPSSYHAECMKIETPAGSWYCQDCIAGKRPLYGDIVWVKLGNYRWWPGEICHPKNVPLNIQEKPHQVGEFPVRFLGSHDYFWLHQGRVFAFQDGDKGSKDSSSNKSLHKIFSKGLVEAAQAYKIWKSVKDDKEKIEMEKNKKKPPYYKHVKNNIPIGNVQINKGNIADIPRCECKPTMDHPCGSDSDCFNRMMLYECHPATCPAGEKCENQNFTKRNYPRQEARLTEERGWGLHCLEDIKKGQFVNEYVGDLVDEEECKRRIQYAHENNISNFYMLTLDKDRIIDAGPKGNWSRFMNHSCNPNLETQKWHVNGDVRVGLFALQDITAGSELTFNYNLDCLGNEKTVCRCGAPNCSGFLGVRPKTAAAAAQEKKSKEAKQKKKKKISVKRKHDDDCFRCGEGGELVMCDRGGCPKSYHLECLGLDKPPHGKWDCPWHHCDTCGKPSIQLCVECPNSFCNAHIEGNIKEYDGKLFCTDHEELLESLVASVEDHASSDETSETSSVSETAQKSEDTEKGKESNKAENTNKAKESINKFNVKSKEKAKKSQRDTDGKKGHKSASEKSGEKSGSKNGKKSGRGNSVSDDPLAVAPMFDDSEEEEFNLVIDIPNI